MSAEGQQCLQISNPNPQWFTRDDLRMVNPFFGWPSSYYRQNHQAASHYQQQRQLHRLPSRGLTSLALLIEALCVFPRIKLGVLEETHEVRVYHRLEPSLLRPRRHWPLQPPKYFLREVLSEPTVPAWNLARCVWERCTADPKYQDWSLLPDFANSQ